MSQLVSWNKYVPKRWRPSGLNAILVGGFAILDAVIAAVGVFGVQAFSVSQRTKEFGVRLSFGADGRSFSGLVLREGLKI